MLKYYERRMVFRYVSLRLINGAKGFCGNLLGARSFGENR